MVYTRLHNSCAASDKQHFWLKRVRHYTSRSAYFFVHTSLCPPYFETFNTDLPLSLAHQIIIGTVITAIVWLCLRQSNYILPPERCTPFAVAHQTKAKIFSALCLFTIHQLNPSRHSIFFRHQVQLFFSY